MSLIAVAMLATACGGGGGAGAETETPLGREPDNGPSASQPLVVNANAFAFQADTAVASDQALDTVANGQKLHSSWNPVRGEMLTPGMKVSFFGRAAGCDSGLADGPVLASSTPPEQAMLARMAVRVSPAGFVRDWQPSGESERCSDTARSAIGPSRVTLNADTAGAVGLYTHAAAVTDSGATPFFGAYDAGGQNGEGTNAYNTSSFVTFRMDWRGAPRRPWVAEGQSAPVARIHTRQSVGEAYVHAPAQATQPVQAKQFTAVAFINNACAAGGITANRPCVVKYLLPLAIAQTGVDDWSKVGWFNSGRVWFDPVQGGMPIVEGSPAARGTTAYDATSGLALFSSAGAAAAHAAFSDVAFDVRIGFGELVNVLRIVAARQANTTPAAVSDAQMTSAWGTAWNDAAQWSLLTVAVGQEVHNPHADGVSRIGGAFSSVYVGPQP